MKPHRKHPAAILLAATLLLASIPAAAAAAALEKPAQLIEETVQTLLDQFTSQRERFEADELALFAMVDRVAVPLFNFERIAKLVLARNWRQASEQQRAEFAEQFKKLLINTYASALFQYTGNETVLFTGSKITERKGRKFAVVNSEVTLSGGAPIPVDYSLILEAAEGDGGSDDGGSWKIYNLSINGLNMVTNYRNTYAAAIDQLGLDGVIESMKQTNQQTDAAAE